MIFQTPEELLANMKVGDTFWYVHCSLTGYGIHLDGPLIFKGFKDKPNHSAGRMWITYLGPNSQLGWESKDGWSTPVGSFLCKSEQSIVSTTEQEAREYYNQHVDQALEAERTLLPRLVDKFLGKKD